MSISNEQLDKMIEIQPDDVTTALKELKELRGKAFPDRYSFKDEILKWKFWWMEQEGYRSKAFPIDSNMMHDLERRMVKYLKDYAAPVSVWPSDDDIRMAAARAWCNGENVTKVLDPVLAEAITQEIKAAQSSQRSISSEVLDVVVEDVADLVEDLNFYVSCTACEDNSRIRDEILEKLKTFLKETK